MGDGSLILVKTLCVTSRCAKMFQLACDQNFPRALTYVSMNQ
jgi:hypothetical protein